MSEETKAQGKTQTAMMGVKDEETHRLYISRLDKAALRKLQFITQRLPQLPHPLLIVDFGCLTGTVAAKLKQEYPQDNVEGIDINPSYILQAIKTYGNMGIKYNTIGAIEKLPYSDSTVSAYCVLAVFHEIFSFNNFQANPVISLISEMLRSLTPGGRVIIREPAKPENPNELLRIVLDDTEGISPLEVEDLLETPPSQLSQAALMKRFLLQFKPLRNSALVEHGILRKENSYTMPAWLISEFFRKRANTVTPEFFESEMEEQTCAFTAEDLKQLALEAGFNAAKIDVVSAFENVFYGRVKPEDITISDTNGNPIDQTERFPSHLHGLLIK